MNAKPILFSAPMMRALADGSKTQTRRVVALNNSLIDGRPYTSRGRWWGRSAAAGWTDLDFTTAWVDQGPSPAGNPGPYLHVDYPPEESTHRIYPAYWQTDLLWVKEGYRLYTLHEDVSAGSFINEPVRYEADGVVRPSPGDNGSLDDFGRYRSSRFMPRWASRYTLRLADVRVERVQDISGVDAVAEGCAQGVPECDLLHYGGYGKARREFRELWDSLNAARGFGWEANPWVWALSFDVLAENVDAVMAREAA